MLRVFGFNGGEMHLHAYAASEPVHSGVLTSITLPTGTIQYQNDPATGKLASISGPYGVSLSLVYDGHLRTDTTWTGAVSASVHTSYNADFVPASETINGAHSVKRLGWP